MNQHETASPSVSTKKQVRKEIFEKLTGALADYKQDLGEKKIRHPCEESQQAH